MNVVGENDYLPLYPMEEEGVGKTVGEVERLVFFKLPETIYQYTIDEDVKIIFIHKDNVLGYLE